VNQPERVRLSRKYGYLWWGFGAGFLADLGIGIAIHSTRSPDAKSNCVGIDFVIYKKLGIGSWQLYIAFQLHE